MYIDSHCHYDLKQFNDNRFQLLAQIKSAGIGKIIVPAILPESNDSMRQKLDYVEHPELLNDSGVMADELPEIYYAAGVHPTRVWRKTEVSEDIWEKRIRLAAKDSKVIAIGETGLDYHHVMDEQMMEMQHTWFHKQLQIAEELELPVVLHIRMAEDDAISVLCKYALKQGGVAHCFAGDWNLAEKYLDMGLMIGIGGALTLLENEDMREAVKQIPLERILLETDAPYVKPVWCEDDWNTSLHIPRIAQIVAELKGVSLEIVEEVTTKNAEKLFKF